MQQFQGRPVSRERKDEMNRVSASPSTAQHPQERRSGGGDPSKFNVRSERRRIGWENDLYERQSI
ncbi:MAG: hypothetical protein M3Q06_11275 [Bacteroidota bacterium]|nr:hypothetical protein [Bacteroidota bacterium]